MRGRSDSAENTPGEPAPQAARWPHRERIGPPDCPLLIRWTLLDLGKRGCKVMVHHSLPNADDRAVHDHPRGFVTIILRGRYDDMMPCPTCGLTDHPGRVRRPEYRPNTYTLCPTCTDGVVANHDGVVLRERMRPGMVRYRAATHQHRTKVGPRGCWTVVVMGPLRRPWGFIVAGAWMRWREFEQRYGFGMRCGDES